MKKILVVGSNGYIAKHLVQTLSQRGISNLVLTDVHQNPAVSGNTYVSCDLVEGSEKLAEHLENCYLAFFFAGLTGTLDSFNKYRRFVEINELGLLGFLEVLRRVKSSCKVVFPSTRLVYKGKKNTFLQEDDEKEFKTVYAMNKFVGEQCLKMYSNYFDIRYTVFRLCVVYGSTVDDKISYGTIDHFLSKAKRGEGLTVYGSGEQKRTLTHVSDLCDIIVSASLDNRTDNDVFNVGGADHLSVRAIAEGISVKYGVSLQSIDWPVADRLMESGDTLFDSSKLDRIYKHRYNVTYHQWLKELA